MDDRSEEMMAELDFFNIDKFPTLAIEMNDGSEVAFGAQIAEGEEEVIRELDSIVNE